MEKRSRKREILIPTKFGEFLFVFESNHPDPGFTVTSAAAPGFVTYGRNYQEAKRNAKSGIEFHCECVWLEHPNRADRILERATV